MHGSGIGDLLDKHIPNAGISNISNISDIHNDKIYSDILLNICELQSKFTILPLDSGNCIPSFGVGPRMSHPSMYPLAHSHTINYAGGYYTYLYAKLWSAQIWCNLFDKNPLSRDSGVYLWDNLLVHGAAKDPLTMLESLGSGPHGDGKPIPLGIHYYIQNR